MLLALFAAAALAQAPTPDALEKLNAGIPSLLTGGGAPTEVFTRRRTDCEVDFQTDLIELRPAASHINLEQVLEIITTYNPKPIAVAISQEPYLEIGLIDADPENLEVMMECTNAGAHFSAKVLPGVYKVHVTRVPDFF